MLGDENFSIRVTAPKLCLDAEAFQAPLAKENTLATSLKLDTESK